MAATSIQLHKLLRPEMVVDLESTTKRDALNELGGLIGKDPNVLDARVFMDAIFKREALVSTGVGLGIAIPHVKIPEVKDYVVAVGRRADGIEFDALDSQPVRIIFMIGASERQTRDFVKMLACVMNLLKSGTRRVELLDAAMPDQFIEIVRKHDEAIAKQA